MIFGRQVGAHLTHRGFRVSPQLPIGRYRIELVVEGAGRRIAVECDGDRYHPQEKLAEDLERQGILERLGWKFTRIRGSVFFRDPDGTMDRVVERLHDLGVEPVGRVSDSIALTDVHSNHLVDAIVRRAAELRTEWLRPDSVTASAQESDVSPEVTDGEDLNAVDEEIDLYATEAKSDLFETDGEDFREAHLQGAALRTTNYDADNEREQEISETTSLDVEPDQNPDTAKFESDQGGFDLVSSTRISSPQIHLPDRVLALLENRSGLKAREIARELGEDRKDINSLLYGRLGQKVFQDDEYRWRLR